MGLDDHLARLFRPSGAPGHLHDQLRHTLAGAEVAGEQSAVGIQNRHQRNPREVMPLGQHLRADQNARLSLLNRREQLIHRVLARGTVTVNAQHRVIREQNRQAFFGAFGAGADRAQIDFIALGHRRGVRSTLPQWWQRSSP